MRRAVRALLVAGALVFVSSGTAHAAASVEKWGYLTTRDGTKLRYDLVRPAAPAGTRFPVLVNYEGYAAGTDASDNGVSTYMSRLIDRGYAVLGVSVRGTGCSEGQFDPFDHTMGQDGYDAVEWAAQQSDWSNGRVGMIGVSFGGITQVLTAGQRPPHLLAIAPSSSTSDLYRDVAYPGGILEYDFTFAWTGIQKEGGTTALLTRAAQQGDSACFANYASHEAANDASHLIPTLVLQRPFVDDGGDLWEQRAPENAIRNVDVPAFMLNQWQDEQLPARIWDDYSLFPHPDHLWVNVSNGNHGRDYYNSRTQQETLDFLDRFVRGVDNGFTTKVPHVAIWMESRVEVNGDQNVPTWSIDLPGLPKPKPRALYLRAGGMLSKARPAGAESADSYAYPLPAPDVAEPGPEQGGRSLGQFTFKAPVAPGGSVAYTTATLTKDMVLAGPASLDLWLSSTASDTDVQATITEVRPDGQETYVQRGWLRASHRKLNPARTTILRPYQTNLRADAEPLTPGAPTLVRLEVFPFAHAFRAGSRLRVWIDAPTSHTGFFAFVPTAMPAINSVLHDPAHPSRLVVGVLRGEQARAPLPACDTLRNQPCRSDPLGVGLP